MADTRINALSTATSSVSDDFVPIDGTTNGTRKLSAFSPSFGGNATVGGTLTVTGVVTASNAVNASGIIGTTAVSQRITNTSGAFQIYKDATPSIAARFSLNTAASDIAAIGVYNGSSWTDPLQINTTQVLVTTTTASTTTSSGALVVGNGSQGGLGVGGAVNVGGVVKGAQNTHSDANVPTGLNAGFQVDVQAATTRDILTFGDSARHGLIRGYHDGAGTINWQFGRYTASTFAEYLRLSGTTAANAILTVYGTTASTSTSSGALVVSGGVGVAKSINAGAVNETHTLTGGDTGSGTSILVLKDGNGVTKFTVQGEGTTYVYGTMIAHATSNAFRITNSQTPASASTTGTAGTICWDTSYIYVCTATNTWKRAALSTW